MERTLVLVKPDGVQRGLVGKVLERFEIKGFKLVALKMLRVPESTARRHYAQHEGKHFFPSLLKYITSGPVVAMVWEGPNAVSTIREMTGITDPQTATPGSIRGDMALSITFNLVHASDSSESAQREIGLFFAPDEVSTWDRATDGWLWTQD